MTLIPKFKDQIYDAIWSLFRKLLPTAAVVTFIYQVLTYLGTKLYTFIVSLLVPSLSGRIGNPMGYQFAMVVLVLIALICLVILMAHSLTWMTHLGRQIAQGQKASISDAAQAIRGIEVRRMILAISLVYFFIMVASAVFAFLFTQGLAMNLNTIGLIPTELYIGGGVLLIIFIAFPLRTIFMQSAVVMGDLSGLQAIRWSLRQMTFLRTIKVVLLLAIFGGIFYSLYQTLLNSVSLPFVAEILGFISTLFIFTFTTAMSIGAWYRYNVNQEPEDLLDQLGTE